MLMEMLSKHTITIKEIKTLVTEEKEKYEILERKVLYEESRNDELCLKIGANIDVHAKELASLKKAKDSCEELMNDKSKLVKSHASLSKDCELLSVSLKTKEQELTLLTKCFETLKLTYLKTLAKAYSSPIINVDACTTNSSGDLASILEENCFLKAQLKKGLMTCAQGQKNLNQVFAKEGLGFDPSTSKKKTSSQKCTI